MPDESFAPLTPEELKEIEQAYQEFGKAWSVSLSNVVEFGQKMLGAARDSGRKGTGNTFGPAALWQQAARQQADLARTYLAIAASMRAEEEARRTSTF